MRLRLLSISCLLAAISCGPEAPAPTGPCVALVIIDTLRADQLGCYGGNAEVSPELDALAGRGVLFESVLAPSSWTRPSIAGLLTGRHPRSLGIFVEEGDALPEEPPTLASSLQRAGWRTFGITANPNINRCFGFARGFDHYIDSDVVFNFMRPGADETTYAYGHTDLPRSRPVLDRALEFARDAAGRATFLQVDLMEVHEHGRQLRPAFRDRFAGHPDQGYLASIAQLSHDIDRFVSELRGVEGWEDAIVIITSDHGEALTGDHPDVLVKKHGDLLYESQLLVPLILEQPGSLVPRRVRERVRLIDVMPTVLELCGIPPAPDVHGLSLAGLAGGGAAPALPELFVAETAWRGRDKLAVYAEDWRYIENRDEHPGTAPRELQLPGGGENGGSTNQADSNPEASATLSEHLGLWERLFPRASSTKGGALSETVSSQLRAIGYTGD